MGSGLSTCEVRQLQTTQGEARKPAPLTVQVCCDVEAPFPDPAAIYAHRRC
jgi:hypothetical protein